ncbi:sensor histidine kinase [Coraliomargarita parva]|uniref:sensor histidine kinase n=1 Tax=Coraliomargarita parva TaxID=3014050 RepID=UPI0022B5AFF3|nr:ATP-binding protein [Coraliomargarita parva]
MEKSAQLSGDSLRTECKLAGLENALEAAHIGYWQWDLADEFDWNSRTCEMFGVESPPKNLVDFLVLINEDSQETILNAAEQSRWHHKAFDVTVETEKHLGRSTRSLKLIGQINQLAGESGRKFLSGVCLASESMADALHTRSKLKESWEEFFKMTSDLCVEINYRYVFLHANDAFLRTLGYNSRELEGRELFDFIHPEDIANARQKLAGMQNKVEGGRTAINSSMLHESRVRGKDGHYRWLSWSWMVDPTDDRIYAMARDVTIAKHLHEQQEAMMQRLSQSNADLENFASVASHDLREPLRMITSYLRLLQERSPEALDEAGRRYVDYACQGADRMRRLIEDLLAYSRMERLEEAHKPIRVQECVQRALEHLKSRIEETGADIQMDNCPHAEVIGARTHLIRLFQNLLSNAMKFQAPGNKPEIRISFRERRNNSGLQGWTISIQDNGIGISKEHEDVLFQLFRRLNARDEYEGSGIGLAACKRVVDLHEGDIWFDSTRGLGSTFHVWLKNSEDSDK